MQRAFCWASARPAGTGNPLSLFHHLQPIPLCLGWRWSITGIKAAINVLSSRGHRHHSRAHSIFSLSTSLPLPLNSESNSKKVLLAGQIIPCSSKCLLASFFFTLSLSVLCTPFSFSISCKWNLSRMRWWPSAWAVILYVKCIMMHYKQIRSILEEKIHFCPQ